MLFIACIQLVFTAKAQHSGLIPITGFDEPKIEIIYPQEARPLHAEKIGEIKIKKAHFLACDLDNLIAMARHEAKEKGGHAIYLTYIKPPSKGKNCYSIEGDILKLAEPFKSEPTPFYPHEVISSVEDGKTYMHILPLFPGGINDMLPFIHRKINYPNSALRDKLGGELRVSFVVDEHGIISEVEVIEGIRWDLDQEVLRAISLMPEWVPGYINGEAVPVTYTLPVKIYPWLTR